ncbi:hypothetical protein PR202_ga22002 [Eleusine coracana subsp. coracana]|uniref:Uncharacterized protein n=1 Tax=Eleusine coracana subsp. coracana TaxID=191504 RepID=A0AAV5D2D8_ELECO|nr:hypothetical protein PR202_ga22002 [Eleusine coracana subsp. coracana]
MLLTGTADGQVLKKNINWLPFTPPLVTFSVLQIHGVLTYPNGGDEDEHAHIKLEAALQISNKWNVTSAPLIRWWSKLKRAAQECDDMLRSCKKRLQEEEKMEDRSTVCRFEWFADGASDFLRTTLHCQLETPKGQQSAVAKHAP